MRIWSFPLISAVFILAAPGFKAQPNRPINCNGQTCTFTLAFDDGINNPQPAITGAPYSGQVSRENARTLPNGTHTSVTQSGPMTYRDSQGRVRTEQPAYNNIGNGRPAPPDNFTVVQIQDPVAGFQYILDPVNRIAHRIPYKPPQIVKWQPTSATDVKASTNTMPGGTSWTTEPLGTKTIDGIATVGYRITTTGTMLRSGLTVPPRFNEHWRDPRTGESLLSISGDDTSDTMTATMLNYSAAEPDPTLFKIPDGYKVVDETGPFQVVHPRAAGSFSTSISSPRGLSTDWDGNSCNVTFTPGTGSAAGMIERAITGAPWSGSETTERAATKMPDGTERPGNTFVGVFIARDKYGRTRRDPAPLTASGPSRSCPGMGKLAMVEILDPVAGYRYVLDVAGRVAYRIPYQAEPARYEPPLLGPNVGTNTRPDGVTTLGEYLARKTVFGVTAVGHRTTQTSPPGTYMGNDRPVVQIQETWTDPQTGIQLISKSSGPNGDVVRSVADYKAADPDPALFKIPDGYKVIDETGKFTFVIPVAAN